MRCLLSMTFALALVTTLGCPAYDGDLSSEGEGEGEGEGDEGEGEGDEGEGEGGEGAVFRSLVYRELTNEPVRVDERSTSISADGTLAAYSTFTAELVRVFTVPVDGSAAPTEVDSFVPGCCGARTALSADGQLLAWTDNFTLRVRDLAGGVLGEFVVIDGLIKDFVLDDAGNVYFYVARNTSTPTVPFERGLYMMEAGTSEALPIASVPDVSAHLGVGLDEIFQYGNAGPTLGVSADGARLVFGVVVTDPDEPGDALLSLTLPAGTLGTLIARVGAAQTAGPGLRHASLSREGGTVAVEVGTEPGLVDPSEFAVLAFDGSGRFVVASAPPVPGITNFSSMPLSANGFKLLLGDVGHLYNVSNGAVRELPVRGGFATTDPPQVSDGSVFVMDGGATRFLFIDSNASNIGQLVSLIDRDGGLEDVGDAPSISDPTISALTLPSDGATTRTLRATVAGAGLVRVASAMLLDGRRDTSGNCLNSEVLLNDDADDGDESAGDGVFTSASVTASSCTVPGVRDVRIKAESNVGGLRRATAVDFAQLDVQ